MKTHTRILHARLERLCAELRARVEGELGGVSVTFVPALPFAGLAFGERIFVRASLLGQDPALLWRVLAHELTHVSQQRSGRVRPELRVTGVARTIDPVLEAEAEAGAEHVARGGRLPLAPRPLAPLEPVAQPLVTVAGSVRTKPTDFSARFQQVLPLIADGPAWLQWALRASSPPFSADSETDLLAQIQFGLHGSTIALFPSSGLRLAPALLPQLSDPDFGNIVSSLQSGGLTAAALAALGKNGFRTEADFAQLENAFAALGIAGVPATLPASLAEQVGLYNTFVAGADTATPPTSDALDAAQFAASVAQSAPELSAAYTFYLAVAAQNSAVSAAVNPTANTTAVSTAAAATSDTTTSGAAAAATSGGTATTSASSSAAGSSSSTGSSAAGSSSTGSSSATASAAPFMSPPPLPTLVPTLWTAVGGLAFDYLRCPQLSPGASDALVLRGLDVFLRQSPLLGFASIGGAIANCGGNSGIALTAPTLDPAAAGQIADYMQRAARVLRSLNLPGLAGAPATSWRVQRCQDGSSKWYAINAPTGRARLLLHATGLLSLEEFVPAGNTTA